MESSHRFFKHDLVLSQRLIHSTDPKSARSIHKDQFLRGGFPTIDDGILFSGSNAPQTLFTEVRPASDVKMFGYSFYPVRVPLMGPIVMFTLHMKFLSRPQYRMFYNKSSGTQFGPQFNHVAVSQVVFVHEDSHDAVRFAEANMSELDKHWNSILRFSKDIGWTYATRFVDEDVHRPHKVVIGFLGGIRFVPEMNAETTNGKRAGSVRFVKICHEYLCCFYMDRIRSHSQ